MSERYVSTADVVRVLEEAVERMRDGGPLFGVDAWRVNQIRMALDVIRELPEPYRLPTGEEVNDVNRVVSAVASVSLGDRHRHVRDPIGPHTCNCEERGWEAGHRSGFSAGWDAGRLYGRGHSKQRPRRKILAFRRKM